MRSKKTIINTIFSLICDFVAIICSFILPKLILSRFGSAYNGLTTSISQFLTCAVLLRSGIGGATKAALYKPLAENNKKEIDSMWEEVLRFENPHNYYVDLSQKLWDLKHQLISEHTKK